MAQTRKAIIVFNKASPGDIAMFAFDNSSGHACKAKDALVANRMNLRQAAFDARHKMGKRGLSEHGVQIKNGAPILQSPRSLSVRILQERGLWTEDLKKQCGRQKDSST